MQKKLKILFIEPCPVYFGGYFRALNICQGLSNNGHKIDLLVSTNKKFYFGIEKQKINKNLNLYILPRFYFSVFFQGRLLRAIIAIIFGLKEKYDIYHLAMPSSPESNIPALFFKLLNKKTLVIDWDDIYEEGELKTNPIYLKYIKLFEYNFPSIFKNYCVTSQYLAELAQKRGATNIVKIINGVNQNQFLLPTPTQAYKQTNLDPKLKYILSIGNTFNGPRGTLLLETFKQLIKKDNTFRLIVNVNPATINFPLDKNILNKIVSTGFIPPSELGKYMVVSIGALFLSSNSPVEKAGFPMRIGSFINGKLPIFAIQNDTEVSRIIDKYKCGVQSDNLANDIIKTLQNKVLYQKLLNNTIKARESLSVDKLSIQLADYYYSLKT